MAIVMVILLAYLYADSGSLSPIDMLIGFLIFLAAALFLVLSPKKTWLEITPVHLAYYKAYHQRPTKLFWMERFSDNQKIILQPHSAYNHSTEFYTYSLQVLVYKPNYKTYTKEFDIWLTTENKVFLAKMIEQHKLPLIIGTDN